MTYRAKEINPDEKLSITLHSKQLEVYHDQHRFKVLVCGRRFGKTTLCANAIALRALSKPEQVLWIVSPTFPQTMYMWRRIKKILPKKYIKDIKEGEKFIELINGSTIWAKSGDNPDGLVGEGLNFCAIDEAARCKEEVWEVLRPSLSDKNGDCWFLSTPKGKNWFYYLSLKEKEDPQYKSFFFPSHENPILPRSELESMKAEMPELVYMQEVLAKFIDTGGIVFRNLKKCLAPTKAGPVPSHSYVIGIDLGKHQDFTVMCVGDLTTNEVVDMDRFNQLDWTYQKNKIRDKVKQYNNATVILDTTGLGDTIYDDLTDWGISVEPYHFTNSTKNLLISNLMRTMDNQLIRIPDDEPDMVMELESFEFDITETGLIRYGAPRGMHDDIVISLALCAWGMDYACVNVIGRTDDAKALKGEPSYYDEDDLGSFDDDEEDIPRPFGTNRIVMG
jgi:PBSX family phage terminase large subunit